MTSTHKHDDHVKVLFGVMFFVALIGFVYLSFVRESDLSEHINKQRDWNRLQQELRKLTDISRYNTDILMSIAHSRPRNTKTTLNFTPFNIDNFDTYLATNDIDKFASIEKLFYEKQRYDQFLYAIMTSKNELFDVDNETVLSATNIVQDELASLNYQDTTYTLESLVVELDKHISNQARNNFDRYRQEHQSLSILFVVFGIVLVVSFVVVVTLLYLDFKQILQLNLQNQFNEHQVKVKNTFLSNMSHELRTPLNGIYGIWQTLLSDNSITNEKKLRLMQAGLASTLSLNKIINEILDYDKLASHKLELHHEWVTLGPLLRDLNDLHFNAAKHKNVKYKQVFASKLPKLVLVDEMRLLQIVNNLLSNAIKFTEEGDVTLTVSYVENQLTFIVEDSGIGMSKETISCLFERFTQADASTSKRFQGTGLGLAITKELVNLMNGNIDVFSTLGKGSTFIVKVPVESRSYAVATIPEKTHVDDLHIDDNLLASLAKLTILVVEDNDINLMILVELLESKVAKLDTAKNGFDAFEKANVGNFDIVITDIQMPQMDGKELFIKLKREYPNLPVIALTANVMPDDVREYREMGFIEVLGKPIENTKLLQAVAQVGRRHGIA